MKKKLNKWFYIILVLFMFANVVFNITFNKRARNLMVYEQRCWLTPVIRDSSTGEVVTKAECSEDEKFDIIKKNIDKEYKIIMISGVILLGLFVVAIIISKLKGGIIIALVFIVETYLISLIL